MLKNNIIELLKDENSENPGNNGLSGLIEILFKAQTDTHITHLLQRKKLLCEHNAMADFYTEIEDLIDSFAETAMAHDLISNLSVPASSEIMDTVKYFENLYMKVETYRSQVNSYPFLISKIDEIQELISQVLYRLKYIQS